MVKGRLATGKEREKNRNKEGEMWVVGCFGYVVVRNPVTT